MVTESERHDPGPHWLARATAFTRCYLGGDHPPGDHLAAGHFPRPGVAPTTTPNQRPRISQQSARTSTPVSSARHSCHRCSGCTMPATATTWGRTPASRRAAIKISAEVKTLTTSAWTHLVPGTTATAAPSSAPQTPEKSTTVAAAHSPLQHDLVFWQVTSGRSRMRTHSTLSAARHVSEHVCRDRT